jgi:hypothetical protein
MRNFKILFLTLLISSSLQAKREYYKAGVSAASYLGLFICKRLLADNPLTKAIAHCTGHNSEDLTAGLLLGSFLWGSSYLTTNQHARTFLRGFVVTPPLISLLIPGMIWKKVAHIPLLRQYFIGCSYVGYIPLGSFNTCSNKECEGICNQCKLRRLYQTAPLVFGFYKCGKWGMRKLFPTEFELGAKEPLLGKECMICREEYQAEEAAIRLECLHHMCKECAKRTFFNHIFSDYQGACRHCNPTCPECRKPVNTSKLQAEIFV